MSAHRIYCYAPQRSEVVAFLESLGAVIKPNTPYAIDDASQLDGLNHITFLVIDNHPAVVPQAIWEMVILGGAIVIHVDGQYLHERHDIVSVRHYPKVSDAQQIAD